jgi:hypothetical protein
MAAKNKQKKKRKSGVDKVTQLLREVRFCIALRRATFCFKMTVVHMHSEQNERLRKSSAGMPHVDRGPGLGFGSSLSTGIGVSQVHSWQRGRHHLKPSGSPLRAQARCNFQESTFAQLAWKRQYLFTRVFCSRAVGVKQNVVRATAPNARKKQKTRAEDDLYEEDKMQEPEFGGNYEDNGAGNIDFDLGGTLGQTLARSMHRPEGTVLTNSCQVSGATAPAAAIECHSATAARTRRLSVQPARTAACSSSPTRAPSPAAPTPLTCRGTSPLKSRAAGPADAVSGW